MNAFTFAGAEQYTDRPASTRSILYSRRQYFSVLTEALRRGVYNKGIMNDEKLIECVGKYNVLYDLSHAKYMDTIFFKYLEANRGRNENNRFCPAKYYPFDHNILDKYVVGDDYLPIWEVPALDYYYNELGFGMKESLNAYLRSRGQDPSVIWNQIEDAIRTVILAKESQIVNILHRFRSKRNFFEMMRVDFVIDEDLNIYLLEANMSPNLSSAHFPPNRLLYQQVLFNVLGLIGAGERIVKNPLTFRSKSEEEMLVADKQITVFPEQCNSKLCRDSCVSTECHLCKNCLSPTTRDYIMQAYKEHVNKGDCKRIFPPLMIREEILSGTDTDLYTPENQLQYKWFQGKCLLDSSWC